jgi:filamentous hemagglutinin
MVKVDPQLVWLKEAEKRGMLIMVREGTKTIPSNTVIPLGQGNVGIIIAVTVPDGGCESAISAASAGSAVGAGPTMAAATAGTVSASRRSLRNAPPPGNIIITPLTSLASTKCSARSIPRQNLGAFKELQ